MGRKVILQTYAKCRGELAGNAEGFFILESTPAIVDVIDISETAYRQFQHESRRRVKAEMRFVVPLPAKTERNAKIVQPLKFLNIGLAAARVFGGTQSRVT